MIFCVGAEAIGYARRRLILSRAGELCVDVRRCAPRCEPMRAERSQAATELTRDLRVPVWG